MDCQCIHARSCVIDSMHSHVIVRANSGSFFFFEQQAQHTRLYDLHVQWNPTLYICLCYFQKYLVHLFSADLCLCYIVKLYFSCMFPCIMREKGLFYVLISDIDTLCHSSKRLYSFDTRTDLQQWNT